MRRTWVVWGALATMTMMIDETTAAPPGTIENEADVKPYTLPDVLTTQAGVKVTSPEIWRQQRRPELLKLFETEVYGKTLPKFDGITYKVLEQGSGLGGKADRRQVEVRFGNKPDSPTMTILLYLPKRDKPVGAFLGLNFNGNHAVTTEPEVILNTNWMRPDPKGGGVVNHKATEATRGKEASRWQADMVIERGYALATIYYGDIDPDFDDGYKNGVHPLFHSPDQPRPADAAGAIGAWAWGLSRALDYLQTEPRIDPKHVAVIGHSRLGKTSLWAGAADERFSIVISNNSGAGGAALSKRIFGETVANLNKSFPHWFNGNFKKYSDNEVSLPVDQHELIALIAPRPVYIASAQEDLWADPKGEYLSGYHADPVYRLLGTKGLDRADENPPAIDQPVKHGTIGYHNRTGKHDVTAYDWQQYLDFADRHWGSK